MQTKRLRVGQLGIVLPASNPIRVAEDIAMLDHMTGGRANAGFARGYQRRWVDVMAQQMHGIHGALPHHHDAIDAANRVAFEECFQIIKKCWTEEMFNHQGKYWKIPPAGIPWDIEPTGSGAPVSTATTIVTSVGVVPKPVQKPHPPLYQPFASSENSVRWCAKEGVTAILPPMRIELEEKLFRVYADVSGKPYGKGTGLLRDVVIADTDEEATEIWKRAGGFILNNWFEPFGFRKGLVDPVTGLLPTPAEAAENCYQLVGTVDTVTRRLERLIKRAPTENLFAFHVRQLDAPCTRHAHAGAICDQGVAAHHLSVRKPASSRSRSGRQCFTCMRSDAFEARPADRHLKMSGPGVSDLPRASSAAGIAAPRR